jgi:hypothetical protein
MKPLLNSPRIFAHKFANPLAHGALPLFFALAFMPSILHLATSGALAFNPWLALGPFAAGFWLAASLREIRMNFALFGTLLTVFLWLTNWLMLAGKDCCGNALAPH